MLSVPSERLTLLGLGGIFSLVIVFHVLILVRLIPYDIAWGGRLTSEAQMVQFETVSIGINALMLAVVGLRAGVLPVRVPALGLTIAFWMMSGLFALNTVGNLLSTNAFEKYTFTPITLLLSLLCLRLALGRSSVSKG